jgi:hypothetical protein
MRLLHDTRDLSGGDRDALLAAAGTCWARWRAPATAKPADDDLVVALNSRTRCWWGLARPGPAAVAHADVADLEARAVHCNDPAEAQRPRARAGGHRPRRLADYNPGARVTDPDDAGRPAPRRNYSGGRSLDPSHLTIRRRHEPSRRAPALTDRPGSPPAPDGGTTSGASGGS